MRKYLRALAGAVALTGLAACSTTPKPSIRAEAAPDAPLATYHTYSWAFPRATPGQSGNPLIYERVREALDRSLAGAGLSRTDTEEGDMVLAFTIGARDRVDVTDWGPVGPYYPAYGRGYRFGWAYNYNDIDVRTVTEGSLAMDIFDAETDRPVWHGIATARVSSQGASDELIQAAADGLVERFVEARTR
mgnify:CR=1 FL=1